MPLTVSLVPSPNPASVLVFIDVLRFTTSAAYALARGARSILPCASIEEARMAARHASAPSTDARSALLAGERQAVKPAGFDVGNSPLEFTAELVQGRDIAWTTTNGTRAIAIATGMSSPLVPVPPTSTHPPSPNPRTPHPSPARSTSRDLILCSYVNLSAVVAALERELRADASVAVVCSGRDGGFALEDAACAGRLVRRLRASMDDALTMNDGARASACIDEAYGEDFSRLFRDAQHGRFLRDHGFAADLDACGALDALQVVPRWNGGRFVAG